VVPKESRSDNYNKTPEDITRYQEVRVGDLVVNKMKAWQGSVGISAHRGVVSPDYLVCSVSPEVDSRFFHYLLRSAPLASEFGARSKGIRPAQWRLYWEDLAEICVTLPPLDEQRRIADFLDTETATLDDLIAARKCQQNHLDERLKAILIGSLLPDDVHGWKVTRLKYLFDSARNGVWGDDAAGNDQDLVCVRVADFMRDNFRADPEASTWRNVARSAAQGRILRSGNVLLEKSGGGDQSPVGFAVTFDSGQKSVCSNFVAALRVAPNVHSRFACLILAALYQSSHNIPHIKQSTGIQNLDGNSYLAQEVNVPPLDQQIAIAVRFDRELGETLALRSAIDSQLSLLAERRQALITAAVTGQIDVTTARGVST